MKKRILLLEDEAPLARTLARLLRLEGHEVYLAGSCEEARGAPGPFTVAVLDIDLPDGNGVDLARDLAANASVRRVIFFTGTADGRMRARAGTLGIVVDKAAGFPALQAALAQSLGAKRALVVGGEPNVASGSSHPPPSGVRPNGKTGKG